MNDMLLLFLKIMLINIVLSGDNAVVIAMASRELSPAQRKQSIRWGSIGAVMLRLVLTVVAVYLLEVPFLQAIGSLLLFYIAIKLLADHGDTRNIQEAATLSGAIRTIIIADFVMSLDNVLAIAAVAGGELLLTVIGVSLSIPLIVWGSTMIMRLLDRFPVLVYLGAAILGYTAGEMILNDKVVGPLVAQISPRSHQFVPIIGASAVITIALLKPLFLRKRNRYTQ